MGTAETRLDEGSIEIFCPASWQALRFDDPNPASFYQRKLQKSQDLKGVDFLLSGPDEDIWIEVKDYRNVKSIDLRVRFSTQDPDSVQKAKRLIEDNGIPGVVARRKDLSLGEEVAAKIRDTALGLIAAQRANEQELAPFASRLSSGCRIRTVVVLETDLPDFGSYAGKLKTVIEQRLRLFDDIEVTLVNGANNSALRGWRIEVGEPVPADGRATARVPTSTKERSAKRRGR